jgi:ketosteroid isomerase-like protein
MAQTITSEEAADRLAIRALIDAYAHCADRRDAAGQMALFTEDAVFHVFMDSKSPTATYVLHGREALAPVFADLNQYAATTHFNGQSTIHLDGDQATRRELLYRPSPDGGRRKAHDDDGFDPLSRSLHEEGWHLAICRAQADGRLDRYAGFDTLGRRTKTSVQA